MNVKEIAEKKIKRGRFFSFLVEADITPISISPDACFRVIKHSVVNARFGVTYKSLKSVKERYVESNPTKSVWFEHTENVGIVRHKKDASKVYLEVTNPKISQVAYFIEIENIRIRVTKAALIEANLLRDKKRETLPVVLTYSINNIVSINEGYKK